MTLPEALADQPVFRHRQVEDWLYRKLAGSWSDMANLPLALRARLLHEVPFSPLTSVDELRSSDGQTIKMLFALPDGQTIESVLMRTPEGEGRVARNTVCVSSQAGCKMGCSFCATGHGGWQRNLQPAEIAGQVLHFARLLKPEGARVTNVVFMGMGEPLDNYGNVLAAVHLLNGPFGLAARSITISTCGLVPQIRRLAGEPLQVNLAVSLAATTDERRSSLIPANRRWPIVILLEACDAYARKTHRRVSFEYVLIAGVNDSTEEAQRLAAMLRGRLAHVNLIPLNPVQGDTYARPQQPAIRHFESVLRREYVPVSVRYSKGIDIVAGCGQLRARRAS